MAGLRNLCEPALFYLMISTLTLFFMILQNLGNNQNAYSLGNFNTSVSPSIYIIFALKIVYIIFWTWIINLICNTGAVYLAWLMVLIPYVLLFVFIFILIFSYRIPFARYGLPS